MGVLTLPLTVLADSPLGIFLRVLCGLPLYIDYSQVRFIHQHIIKWLFVISLSIYVRLYAVSAYGTDIDLV